MIFGLIEGRRIYLRMEVGMSAEEPSTA